MRPNEHLAPSCVLKEATVASVLAVNMVEEVELRMKMEKRLSKLVRSSALPYAASGSVGRAAIAVAYRNDRIQAANSRMRFRARVLHADANIAVRVRPALKPDDPNYELVPQRFQRPMVHVINPTSLAVDVPQGRKLFVFDRVFSEAVDQDGIWEYLSDSVTSFLQGYNVSILAYGQSGAGKSYTMGTSGPTEQHDPKSMGEYHMLWQCTVR